MHGPASRALAWQLGLYSKTMAFPAYGGCQSTIAQPQVQVSFEKEGYIPWGTGVRLKGEPTYIVHGELHRLGTR